MNSLDLFSGTGSWKKVMNDLSYNVISVDITNHKGKFEITHKVDILEWDYKIYDKNYFDIISAGCPCIWYSILQLAWVDGKNGRKKKDKITGELYTYTKELYEKDLIYSDKLVLKTLEIIDYFKPRLWFIENPYSSLLRKREFMKDKPFYVVDYCRYGFDYKKTTIIFTNKKDFKPKRCLKNKCKSIIKYKKLTNSKRNKHVRNTGSGGDGFQKGVGGGSNRLERYKVPYKLIYDLIK
jgi:hypothetical protein